MQTHDSRTRTTTTLRVPPQRAPHEAGTTPAPVGTPPRPDGRTRLVVAALALAGTLAGGAAIVAWTTGDAASPAPSAPSDPVGGRPYEEKIPQDGTPANPAERPLPELTVW